MDDGILRDIEAVAAVDVVPKILQTICRLTGMGFAAVARVTPERWVACAVRDQIDFGLVPGGELPVETTICHEIRQSGRAVIIDHVAEDDAFKAHSTPAMYGFQSYISVPIYSGGAFFGTLCAIDPKPADLRGSMAQETFELFAELIGQHLDARERLARSERALLGEREIAEFREQFIAVLGHDLRNPLAAIEGASRLLARPQTEERAAWIHSQMQASIGRMTGLIDNVMDFARARLGGGFTVERVVNPKLGQVLEQVIMEMKTARPDREINAHIALDQPVAGDSRRLAQVFSNLLANALNHGRPDAPVEVFARTGNGQFEVAVANQGEMIPEATLEKLFLPFSRAAMKPNKQGLGLGLYIASEIARAHGGSLTATSNEQETRFTFRIPVA
jgi:signal transduction histidine kinase